MRNCLDVLLVGGGFLDLRRVVVWWVERIVFGIEKKRTTLYLVGFGTDLVAVITWAPSLESLFGLINPCTDRREKAL